MDLDATVVKLVDLAAVKIKDLKTRRIFIMADGKRSLRNIFTLSKFAEQEGIEMARALIDGGYINLGGSATAPTVSTATTPGKNEFTFTEEDIEFLADEMGKYIGPFSTVLVRKTVKAGQSFSPKAMDELFERLALKIENKERRSQFLVEIRADFS